MPEAQNDFGGVAMADSTSRRGGASPASPPKRRPLKRTASTASLPPTPPRTYSRYSRGRSRGSCDSSDESDAVIGSGGEEDEKTAARHKKQRTTKAVGGDGDEEAFWLGGAEDTVSAIGSGAGTEERTRGRDLTRGNSGTIHSGPANEDKSDIPLLYRKRRAQLAAKARVQAQQASASSSTTLDSAPVSPPPSHRKPMPVPAPLPAPVVAPAPTTPPCSTVLDPSKLITPSPPVTPKTQTRLRQRALLDSPDNPFLDTPEAEVVEDSATPSPETATDSSPKTPAPFQEKPTITYVFRGVRRVYDNPLFNHASGRPFSPPPASKLPVDHPDYSPSLHITPKLLFPQAPRKTRAATKARAAAEPTIKKKPQTQKRSSGWSDDEDLFGGDDDEDDAEGSDIKPLKLVFGEVKGKGKAKGKAGAGPAKTLAQELKNAGELAS